jgi:hypothetical protein
LVEYINNLPGTLYIYNLISSISVAVEGTDVPKFILNSRITSKSNVSFLSI